jgi:hypothetical protein
MGNRKYRTVVAAVLAGAVLFSPLLCGMTRLEGCGVGPSAGVEFVPRVGELAVEITGSALVGCVLSHVVSKIDFSRWTGQVDIMTWVWVGVGALRLSDGVWAGEVLWR